MTRFYEPTQMAQAAELFGAIKDAIDAFEPVMTPSADHPLYVFGAEIVIRHRDDYTIGRIAMDDYLYFEFTDERYGEEGTPSTSSPERDDDSVMAAVQDALDAHIRQENTAAGQFR